MSFQSSKEKFSSKVQTVIKSVSSISTAANDRLKVSLNTQERNQLKRILGEVEVLQILNRRVSNSNGFMEIVTATEEASRGIREFKGMMKELETSLHDIITNS